MDIKNVAHRICENTRKNLMNEMSIISPPSSLRPIRKLSGYITDVMLDDVAIHGIDVLEEIGAACSQELRAEITQNLLAKARQIRPCATFDFSESIYLLDPVKIADMIATIKKHVALHGNYSVVIVSPVVLTLLQTEGVITRTQRESSYPMSIPEVGLMGNIPILCDQYGTDNTSIIVAGTRWAIFPEDSSEILYDIAAMPAESPEDPVTIARFRTPLIPMINPDRISIIDVAFFSTWSL